MFCKWCNQLIEEDLQCDNKICIYLTNKLKELGLFQFYLKVNCLEHTDKSRNG